ncbi:MAG: hypothetical protein QE271_02460 [Bacteriovoracaceae bacterium]|nr:hypothetical protein [Bacteriovoracaceae bacterium]
MKIFIYLLLANLCIGKILAQAQKEQQENSVADDTQRLVIKITNPDQIPGEFRDTIPMPYGVPTSKRPLSLGFSLVNDNLLLGIRSGNDTGYTHGFLLDIGATNKNGITWGGRFFTGLYTKEGDFYQTDTGKLIESNKLEYGYLIDNEFYQRIYGDDLHYTKNGIRYEDKYVNELAKNKSVKDSWYAYDLEGKMWAIPTAISYGDVFKESIRFNEETMLKLFANNKSQGKWYLWSVEAGFRYLNSQDVNKFLATGIQKGWHNFLGKTLQHNIVKYDYIPDENDTKMGIILRASVGVQKGLYSGEKCSINFATNQGFQTGTAGTSSFVFGDISTQFHFGVGHRKNVLGFAIGADAQKNKKIFAGNYILGASFQTKRATYYTTFQIPFCQPFFNGNDVYQDRDTIQHMGVIFPLASKQESKAKEKN